jgi:hypothetical protein
MDNIEIAYYYFYSLLSILIIFYTGRLFTSLVNYQSKNTTEKTFVNFFFGTIVIVVLHSIFITKGLTISFAYIFMFFLCITPNSDFFPRHATLFRVIKSLLSPILNIPYKIINTIGFFHYVNKISKSYSLSFILI